MPKDYKMLDLGDLGTGWVKTIICLYPRKYLKLFHQQVYPDPSLILLIPPTSLLQVWLSPGHIYTPPVHTKAPPVAT